MEPADNLFMASSVTFNFVPVKKSWPFRTRILWLGLPVFLAACGGGSDNASSSETAAPLPNAAVVFSSASATLSSTTAAGGDTSCGLNPPAGIQAELLERVNALRASGAVCGGVAYPAAGALSWNTTLLQAATVHAIDMANNNYFSHTGQDGRSPDQRVLAAGYSYARMGENIAAGQPNVESAMGGWVGSASHCKNMMTPDFKDIAVACVRNESAKYRLYWVMEMGRPL